MAQTVCPACKGSGRVYTRSGPKPCRCSIDRKERLRSSSTYMLTEAAIRYRMGETGPEQFAIAVRRASSDYSFREMANLTKLSEDTIRNVYEC